MQEVLDLLEGEELTTPRVMRCVLYLSGGSLRLFKYHAKNANMRLREILVQAEYTTRGKNLFWVRDMTLPFTHERNSGDELPVAIPPIKAKKQYQRRGHLAGQRFSLGNATYTVLPGQTRRDYIHCHRRVGGVSRSVRLPLAFVVDQIAEKIDLSAPQGS